jgi:hypothetical protein
LGIYWGKILLSILHPSKKELPAGKVPWAPFPIARFQKEREKGNVFMDATYFDPVKEVEQLISAIEQLLHQLSITGKLDGFWYLRDALVQVVHNPSKIRFITKELYPEIAARHVTEPRRVERSMRTAIEISWRKGGGAVFNELCRTQFVKRPTNAEFLDLLASYLRHLPA